MEPGGDGRNGRGVVAPENLWYTLNTAVRGNLHKGTEARGVEAARDMLYLRDESAGMELIFCGNSSISYPPHNHVSVFAAGLVLRGEVSLTVGGDAFVRAENDTFFLPPNTLHRIEAGEPYSLLTICVDKRRRLDGEANRDHVRRMLAAVPGLELTQGQLARVFGCLMSFSSLPESGAAAPFVTRAREQIQRRPEDRLRVEELARALYVSEYHFIRSFKRAVGLTPHQFQIQNRVRKAQRMLNASASAAEAALAAGFCDQSHFIRQFQKYMGLTPGAYQSAFRRLP